MLRGMTPGLRSNLRPYSACGHRFSGVDLLIEAAVSATSQRGFQTKSWFDFYSDFLEFCLKSLVGGYRISVYPPVLIEDLGMLKNGNRLCFVHAKILFCMTRTAQLVIGSANLSTCEWRRERDSNPR